jgi:hypothetical protein
MRTIAGLTVILCAAALVAGCGPDRPPTVRVSGTITFDGSPPPTEGMVYFAAQEAAAGLPRRGGRGPFGEDGRFKVTSFDQGDGLVPGTYVVNVECWKAPPMMDDPNAGQSYVADEYFEKPQTVEIPADKRSHEVNIDVPLAD